MHGFSANTAGTGGRLMGSHFLANPRRQIRSNYEHHVRGVFKVLGYLAPSSSIVNVSSLYGIKGTPLSGPYYTSKPAIIGLTKAAAYEVGPSNIRVNAVYP
ncbi:hypothetical protein BDV24DRAFT_162573 [Aspergillus arachidicola]|uniref:Uncharacterized protein n=1 Tax=Aspergillus arachidicola TaxID=656916 RepID=A0A5N6YAT7_9EURO|nr:hypothetical protein BDV24DRAFT_162573 [Aspergillus arachidicola]